LHSNRAASRTFLTLSAKDYAAFEAWRKPQTEPASKADEFTELRLALQEEGIEDGIEITPLTSRPKPFEEWPEGTHELSR
jgi:hypothetical protein